jgi:hypothetical protein
MESDIYATSMNEYMGMNEYMISKNGMNVNAKEFVPSVKLYVVETIFRKHCEERREFNKEIMEKYKYETYVD